MLGEWKPLIRAWVEADQELPKKQRHTARRIWQRLVAEHGARVGESTVGKYVAAVRGELSGGLAQVMVPQTHRPGADAEGAHTGLSRPIEDSGGSRSVLGGLP